jgi:hypothetical protein
MWKLGYYALIGASHIQIHKDTSKDYNNIYKIHHMNKMYVILA